MRIAIAAALALAVVAAFFAGRSSGPSPRPAPVEPAPSARTAPPPPPAAATTREVRAAVRAELARAPEATPEEPVEDPEEAERRDHAALDAREIVDRAVGSRRWTREDALALRAAMPDLRAEDFDVVMSALVEAANSGRLDVQTSGSLLAID